MAIPHTSTIKESHRDGRRYLSARLLGTLLSRINTPNQYHMRWTEQEIHHLEESVGEEKYCEGHKILLICDVQVLLHAVQLYDRCA